MKKNNGKLKELSKLLKENNITAETIEKNTEIIEEMKKQASKVQDYRNESYVRHLLVDVIMITFFAVLANADEWSKIEVFAKEKETWLRKYLELPHGVPTDDTIRLIISNIDTRQFYNLTVMFLIGTINEMLSVGGVKQEDFEPDIIAVDGKESRGSKREETSKDKVTALRCLNVYSTSYRCCIIFVYRNLSCMIKQ